MDEKNNFEVQPTSQPIFQPTSQPTSSPTKTLPGVIAILKESWQIFKLRWLIFLGVGLLGYLLIGLLVGLIVFIMFVVGLMGSGGFSLEFLANETLAYIAGTMIYPRISSEEIAIMDPLSKIIRWIGMVFMASIIFFLFLLVHWWEQTALLQAIKDSKEGIGIIESYRRAWTKILSYGWIAFLRFLAILGGLMLFIIPGIVFAVWFGLSHYIFIAENVKGTRTLAKSREYLKGNWWSVAWRFLFIGLFSMGVVTAITVIGVLFIFLFFMGMGSVSITTEAMWLLPFISFIDKSIAVIYQLFPILFSLFLFPFITLYSFLIYHNLKIFKEKELIFPEAGQ